MTTTETSEREPLTILTNGDWREGIEGIFRDLPEDVYRAAPGINVSSIKRCGVSMLHYRHGLEEHEDEDKKARHLVIGTLAHLLTLEPERIAGAYVKRPAEFDSWRTKAAQAWRDSQSLPCITDDEEEQILGVVKSLKADPMVESLLSGAERELSAFKKHPRTGLLLKGRADIVTHDGEGRRWGADIKTVRSGGTTSHEFSRTVADRDYHWQEAHYRFLFELDKFVFIAAEKFKPFDVAIDSLDDAAVEIGRRNIEAWLLRIADCRKTDVWPGNGGRVRANKLPRWKEKLESDLE